ncbi:MAG: hypothetical protein Q9220_005526 [cf. Caloplaca sp. 1 TL-2023]
MKFGRELERDLVPEWRAKYLDYKVGKKRIKAIAKALRSLNQTPKTPGRKGPTNILATSAAYQSPLRDRTNSDTLQVTTQNLGPTPISTPAATPHNEHPTPLGKKQDEDSPRDVEAGLKFPSKATPINIQDNSNYQGSARDSSTAWDSGAITNYGSIISSPPNRIPPFRPPSLELPDPALPPEEESFARHNRAWRKSQLNPYVTPPFRQTNSNDGPHPYEIGPTHHPPKATSSLLPRHRSIFKPRRIASTPGNVASPDRPRLIRRIFSTANVESPHLGDVPLAGYKEFDTRQLEFEKYLDSELEKIESFYKSKEQQAGQRLLVLRQQLHEMRDRRIEEVRALQRVQHEHKREQERLHAEGLDGTSSHLTTLGSHGGLGLDWRHPIDTAVGLTHHVGKNSKAFVKMGPADHGPKILSAQAQMDRQDFTRRPTAVDDVSYRVAKKKLRAALQEFYRGLELLKSYALLNRTAFRKINKKYDKTVKARPTGRFMTDKVNKAWFVQSEVLESQIVAVEDLYARYFERGNHKVAVGKLRSRSNRTGNHNGSVFRNGLLLAAGAVFGVQGLVYGAEHLVDSDTIHVAESSYLLQIYGGYFLALLLVLLFCLNCRVWSRAKINYVFIFEFDTRHNLDWHQLCEVGESCTLWEAWLTPEMQLPCLLWFLLGLTLWLNFQQSATNPMFLYWPIILVVISAFILFSRLLIAGVYPVEFRDFFLGDMYCSLTYAMGNLELFFCLYVHSWNQPAQCNSTHSRLLGFFSTLPGIWRAIWDLAMDWSLCNPYAEHPFLRDVLGYKSPWTYYLAMIIDPILRFNWVFYVIFTNELQHSALLSFIISLSEIGRRAMWTLFRVENEHCTNVGRFRASRDVPLPYEIQDPSPAEVEESRDQFAAHEDGPGSGRPLEPTASHLATGAQVSPDLLTQQQSSGSSLRRRQSSTSGIPGGGTPIQRGIARVGTIVTQAHAQDFERRRRPGGTPLERQLTYEGRHHHHPGKAQEAEDDVDSESEDEDEEGAGSGQEDEENEEARVRVDDILERRRSAIGG